MCVGRLHQHLLWLISCNGIWVVQKNTQLINDIQNIFIRIITTSLIKANFVCQQRRSPSECIKDDERLIAFVVWYMSMWRQIPSHPQWTDTAQNSPDIGPTAGLDSGVSSSWQNWQVVSFIYWLILFWSVFFFLVSSHINTLIFKGVLIDHQVKACNSLTPLKLRNW